MRRALAPALAGLAAACGVTDVFLGGDGLVLVADVQPEGFHDVDVLFVIDDSGSMGEEQQALVAYFDGFVASLESLPGGLPGLHLGVVSTDMGVGGVTGIQYCDGEGGGGRLQASARIDGCAPPAGAFIADLDNGDGTRDRNYSGTLAESFGCIALLGIQGCGFEQPLEAMRRALDGSIPGNDGFLRRDALLAVVFLTDEDDCSARDPALFSPERTSLGGLDSFRCFAQGVVCDQTDASALGEHTGCRSNEHSTYVHGVAEYAEFLASLKPRPGMIAVSQIVSPRGPALVTTNARGEPTLAPVCGTEGSARVAYPAVRLHDLRDRFPARSSFSSICASELEQPLLETSLFIAAAVGQSPCLLGAILDVDPAREGLQPLCRAYDAVVDGPDVRAIEIPACDGSGDRPCFRLQPDLQACGHTDSHLAVTVERDGPRPAGMHLLVRCLVP